MKQFFLKYWWAPIAIATIIAFWQYKVILDKQKAAGFGNDKVPAPKSETGNNSNTTTVSTNCTFPLKVGSKNDCVQQLQIALGVTPDKIFGKKETLPALQAATGKSQINDAKDLTDTISAIKVYKQNSAISTQKKDRAKGLLDIWMNKYNSINNIQILQNTTWVQVEQDAVTQKYVDAGFIKSWKKGQKLSVDDFRLTTDIDNEGNIIIEVPTQGTLTGFWKANPLDINFV